MGTSRTLVAPGLRTDAAVGWPADAATISGTLRAHPLLLAIGMIGFALRGGIVLLTVPILVLPTSVEVRLLLGGNLGTSGLTPGFFVLVAGLGAVTIGVALLVLYTLARCELAMFTRFVNSNQASAEHAWLAPGHLSRDDRGRVVTRLFLVESAALLAIMLAAVPVAVAIGQATLSEILLPTSTDSIYARIFNDVAVAVGCLVVALVVIEGISAVAVRRVLTAAFGLSAHNRFAHHPLRVLAVWLAGWALFVGAVALSYAALSVTWQAVESAFLSMGLSGGLRDMVSGLLVALLFGAVFAAALFLCGIVSTVRSGLWTLASLR